jgi:Bardet-Biedl syndrome 2 protein
LVISTTTYTVIQLVAVFNDQIFEGESLVTAPDEPAASVRVRLAPQKDVSTTLQIKAFVGNRGSNVFHVFEMQQKLPKFAMYVPRPDVATVPESSVVFQINERPNRLGMWLQSAFAVPEGSMQQDANTLVARFISLRDGKPMVIQLDANGRMAVATESMEAAGEVVQELAAYLQITELEAVAHFPAEMAEFEKVLEAVDEFNQTRLKLTAEMADSSNLLKSLVIKAEDARILGEMKLMQQIYANLFDLNRDLILEHTKRTTNHNSLLAALKNVNQMIQKAARLRMGSHKMRLVSDARAAIKSNSIQKLFRIIERGVAE